MKHRPESFSDQIEKLFYPKGGLIVAVQGNHVYDITFQVTDACNLACTYCYQHNKTPATMTFDTAKKFIDILLAGDERSIKYINSYSTMGAIINFIGGEPFLEIELINQITEYFLDELIRLNHPWLNRIRFGITTNGTLYFEPKVQKYLNKFQDLISMTITMDGNKQLHDACRLFPDGRGSFDLAYAAASDWRKRTKEETTKITISPYNVDKIYNALHYLIAQEHYKTIFMNCVFEEGWTDKHGSILYQELKRIADYLLDHNLQDDIYLTILDDKCGACDIPMDGPWCGGSGSMICLDPRGDIYPCLRYCPNAIGFEKAQKIKIGDVERGFIYNDQQQKVIDTFKTVTRQKQLACHPECIKCSIQDGCGDCAAYSFEVYEELGKRTNFHCITHIARSLVHCYFYNKSYLKTGIAPPIQNNVTLEQALRIISLEEYNEITEIAKEAGLK